MDASEIEEGISNIELSEIPLSDSGETRADLSQKDVVSTERKRSKRNSMPRIFQRKYYNTEENIESPSKSYKDQSTGDKLEEALTSSTNSLGRRLRYRLGQIRSSNSNCENEERSEDRKSLKSYLSGYFSSIFKKSDRDSPSDVQVCEAPIDDDISVDGEAEEKEEELQETKITQKHISLDNLDESESILEQTLKSPNEIVVG